MNRKKFSHLLVFFLVLFIGYGAFAETPLKSLDDEPTDYAMIRGDGLGWVELSESDFTRVNCDDDTWTWAGNQVHCTGNPVGVLRTIKSFKNFEFVGNWRHLAVAGNSGFFVWTPENVLIDLPPGQLPQSGIEIQILDHGYTQRFEKETGKKADWFRTDGDVFPVGKSTMKPFPPVSPDGSRSFPRERHSKGSPAWNHYYVRAINGEVSLWVNGHEVSGGSDCKPSEGFLCLESEGSPVEFKNIRVRELP